MIQLDANGLAPNQLHTLIENRTTFTLESASLSLFETHVEATSVHLQFDQPVLASMIEGRKVMHLREGAGFNFLPGESIMMPSNELMVIDFPDAVKGHPTKCLALEIDARLIDKVIQGMNERRPRSDGFSWGQEGRNLHFANDAGVTQLIQRLVYLCAEDHPAKDIFVNMALKELLIRLLEIESRKSHLLSSDTNATSKPVTAVVAYILAHLDERLTIKSLSKIACMSPSSLFRVFRNEMGLSPIDFVNNERIKMAARLLKLPGLSVRQVAMRCGFNSASYFTRIFKKHLGVPPSDFQERGV